MYHTLAVKSDGSVWAWGRNVYGQLGDGSTKDRNTPVPVDGLSRVIRGERRTAPYRRRYVATRRSGHGAGTSTECWVTGRAKDQSRPVQVKGLSDVSESRRDSTIPWRFARTGTSGPGAATNTASWATRRPTGPAAFKIDGLGNIKKISAGMYHSIAMMADGTIWMWGKDAKEHAFQGLSGKDLGCCGHQ